VEPRVDQIPKKAFAAKSQTKIIKEIRYLEEYWLSFVKTYRTLLLAPSGEILSLFEMVKSFRNGGID
jgi:hypothetical protein